MQWSAASDIHIECSAPRPLILGVLSDWRVELISTTRLTAWVPLLVLFTWLGLLMAR